MSVAEPVQTTAKTQSTTSSRLVLQRKCACGGSAGFSGECESCRSSKLLGKPLQRKLAISEPGDRYEQEADRIADQVMASSGSGAVTATPVQVQRFTGSPFSQSTEVPASVERVLASPGQPLEPGLREDMETRFDYDFSQIRIHSDYLARQSAKDVNAHAYTVGNHIAFADTASPLETTSGRLLLAHELVHAVQQRTTTSPWLMGQWRSSEAAGGCGICYGELYATAGETMLAALGAVGTEIHRAFTSQLDGELGTLGFQFDRPCSLSGTRPDICFVNERRRRVLAGELKPSTQSGYDAGVRKLQQFRDGLADGWTIIPMPVEQFSFSFEDPFAECTGSAVQQVRIHSMEAGLAGYYCEPPFSVLRRECTCIRGGDPVPLPARERARSRATEGDRGTSSDERPAVDEWSLPEAARRIVEFLRGLVNEVVEGGLSLESIRRSVEQFFHEHNDLVESFLAIGVGALIGLLGAHFLGQVGWNDIVAYIVGVMEWVALQLRFGF